MKKLFALILLFSNLASAKPGDSLAPLRETLQVIRQAKMTEFHFEKSSFSDFTDTKVVKGQALLAGSLFRMKVNSIPKELVVFDGKTIWVERESDPDFPGPPEVLKAKISSKQKNQLVLSELLSRGKLLDTFEMKRVKEEKGLFTFEGTPKDKLGELKKVTVQVQARELKGLEYVDEIGNRVLYKILKQTLQKELSPGKFRYTPPKNAKVSEV